jgi:hypothetical protein
MLPRPLTHEEFLRLQRSHPYYHARWPYLSEAIRISARVKPQRVLELGPYMRPLYSGSDVIDQVVHNPSEPPRWVHDATVAPWPVPSRSYDLFVALQVWEHLRDSQVDAFGEAGRVATWGLLSFPLEWNLKNAGDCHHGITMSKIREWTWWGWRRCRGRRSHRSKQEGDVHECAGTQVRGAWRQAPGLEGNKFAHLSISAPRSDRGEGCSYRQTPMTMFPLKNSSAQTRFSGHSSAPEQLSTHPSAPPSRSSRQYVSAVPGDKGNGQSGGVAPRRMQVMLQIPRAFPSGFRHQPDSHSRSSAHGV